jgi:hypothetical protein
MVEALLAKGVNKEAKDNVRPPPKSARAFIMLPHSVPKKDVRKRGYTDEIDEIGFLQQSRCTSRVKVH